MRWSLPIVHFGQGRQLGGKLLLGVQPQPSSEIVGKTSAAVKSTAASFVSVRLAKTTLP